jgi:hypothetical protein
MADFSDGSGQIRPKPSEVNLSYDSVKDLTYCEYLGIRLTAERNYPSLNATMTHLKNFPFRVNTTNELKAVTTTNKMIHKPQNAKLKSVLPKHIQNIKTGT